MEPPNEPVVQNDSLESKIIETVEIEQSATTITSSATTTTTTTTTAVTPTTTEATLVTAPTETEERDELAQKCFEPERKLPLVVEEKTNLQQEISKIQKEIEQLESAGATAIADDGVSMGPVQVGSARYNELRRQLDILKIELLQSETSREDIKLITMQQEKELPQMQQCIEEHTKSSAVLTPPKDEIDVLRESCDKLEVCEAKLETVITTPTTTIAAAPITTTTTTTTTTITTTSTQEIPIISLSDGDVEEAPPIPEKISVAKKRPSLGASSDESRLKRRKLRVAGAPKMPLTGYVRYMNERRETLRKDFPNKTAMEHTKMIGEEWQHLPEERKAPFMKAAAEDKERYTAELNNFLKLHPDILEKEKAKIKQQAKNKQESKNVQKDKEKPEVNGNNKVSSKDNSKAKESTNEKKEQQNRRSSTPLSNSTNHLQVGEIPIFTHEFLEHNKIFDSELRLLRKSKTDIEQQNAVLEKHVENMKFGVEKLTIENDNLQKKNRLLEIFLSKLKGKLANALSGLPIPSEPNGATIENIDKYMTDLYTMSTSNTHGPASLNKAKDIIRKLDLEIQL